MNRFTRGEALFGKVTALEQNFELPAAKYVDIDGDTEDRTGAYTFNFDIGVNSCNHNVINATVDIGTLLTAGEVVKGSFFDMNEAVVNADTSAMVGYDTTITGFATARADLVGYRATFDGTKNGGDTVKGFTAVATATLNNGSECLYGTYIDFSGITHTNGNVYGDYINVSAAVSSGGSYGTYYTLSSVATAIYIDAGTIDHLAGDIINVNLDVNSASVNGINFDIDVGTALTAGEIVNGININIDGNAADDVGSYMNGIYLTSANTSTGINTGIRMAGTFDTGIDLSDGAFTTDIVLGAGATITNPATDNHIKVNVAVDTGTVRLNSRDFAATSGDIIGFQSKPAGNGDGTATVYGAQISPRFNSGIAGASLVGIQVEPILKGAVAKALSGDVRALDVRLSDDGNAGHTVAGDTCGIKFYNLLKASTFTGGVYAMVMTAAGATQNWSAFAKFDDMAGIASVTNGSILNDISATPNAGYIKVLIGSAVRYIPLYEAKT